VLLDVSAAFDTIDHRILLSRMQSCYKVKGTALKWFESYLQDRYQSVIINGYSSKRAKLHFGVPQGSVLGPKLYTMYTKPLGDLIRRHNLEYHMYADDTQLYIFFKKTVVSCEKVAMKRLECCLAEIQEWMKVNMLKLNSDKTEAMFFCSQRYQHPRDIVVNIDSIAVSPESEVKNLGVIFDRTLSMRKHVNAITRSCNFHLRNIGRIRRYITKESAKLLVHSTVTSRLDYCNALLYGTSDTIVSQLRRVQNRAARIITRTKLREHITPVLIQLHWLPIEFRIQYKILLLTFRAVHNIAPTYIQEMVKTYTPSRSLRSSEGSMLVVPRTKSVCYGDRSFSVAGPTLWNTLPKNIRDVNNIETFRKYLKTYLFKKAYGF